MNNRLLVLGHLILLAGCFPSDAKMEAVREQQRMAADASYQQAFRECVPSAPFPTDGIKEWTTGSKPGDGSVFTFRGSQIGEPITKLFPCYQRPRTNEPINRCRVDPEVEDVRICEDFSSARRRDRYVASLEIGGVPLNSLTYYYGEDRLGAFTVDLSTGVVDRFRDLVIAKYGKPTNSRQTTVQNRMGASFPNTVDTWETPNGSLILEARFATVDEGRLSFINPAFERFKKERAELRAKKKVGGSL
jgi:hypothetical protein